MTIVRRARWTAIAGGVTLALVLAAAPVASQPVAPPPDNPLDAARRAASSYAFSGQVRVRWSDVNGEHEQLVDVRAIDGSLMVEGDAAVMARHDERFIRRGDTWDSLWPAGLASRGAPRPATKYTLTSTEGPTVAGRPTTVVDVRRAGAVVERVWLDAATGLLLGREQYAVAGAPAARSMEFQQISVGPPSGAVPTPRMRPRASEVAATTYPGLPPVLPGGYRRLGAYKRGALVHVAYSDGVYGLSVFEQGGRLRTGALPAGAERVAVGGANGWHYSWAGGHILLWEGRDRVLSAVGDGPLSDLVQAGAGVPLGSRPSFVQRFRSACRSAWRALTGRS